MEIDDNENVVCFDVDDTLVMWDVPSGRERECILFDNFGFAEWLLPHYAHIKLLKQFKVRGQRVIVWSQGGPKWAAEVVKRLGLENWVDRVMSKPKWIVDDLPASAWTKRGYMDLNGKRMPCKDVEEVDFEEIDGDKKPNDQE
jgi:FMN phosphatase YigB (HAD superfamily)